MQKAVAKGRARRLCASKIGGHERSRAQLRTVFTCSNAWQGSDSTKTICVRKGAKKHRSLKELVEISQVESMIVQGALMCTLPEGDATLCSIQCRQPPLAGKIKKNSALQKRRSSGKASSCSSMHSRLKKRHKSCNTKWSREFDVSVLRQPRLRVRVPQMPRMIRKQGMLSVR